MEAPKPSDVKKVEEKKSEQSETPDPAVQNRLVRFQHRLMQQERRAKEMAEARSEFLRSESNCAVLAGLAKRLGDSTDCYKVQNEQLQQVIANNTRTITASEEEVKGLMRWVETLKGQTESWKNLCMETKKKITETQNEGLLELQRLRKENEELKLSCHRMAKKRREYLAILAREGVELEPPSTSQELKMEELIEKLASLKDK